jgi:hypothetical protein
MSSIPREDLNSKASKPGQIVVPSSDADFGASDYFMSEMSAGVIWSTTTAASPSIRSAPTLFAPDLVLCGNSAEAGIAEKAPCQRRFGRAFSGPSAQ